MWWPTAQRVLRAASIAGAISANAGAPLTLASSRPWMLGYSVMGMLSFPLEGEISRGIYHLGRMLTN